MGEARQSRLDRTARWGRWLPLALILIGVLVRGWALGAVPGGLNQDEAFAGYEAWSLLTSGVDSWGYPYPCYLVAWGSGMNALESYLAMPFLALLGCTATALRMPQFLCACLSLPVCYDLLRRMASRRLALVGLGLLAISPWHIMLSRWGLESNLAPAFLLFGFYFLVRGLENQRFLLLSAAAYGISLYAYAINWVVVPLTLCVCGAYLLLSGRRFSWRCLLGAGVILFLLALPLMLFVLVNLNVMEEIVTPWFSIPRMAAMRGSELSLSNLFSAQSWRGVGTLVFLQRDSLLWNAMDGFGMFYLISLPFQLLGAARLIRGAAETLRGLVNNGCTGCGYCMPCPAGVDIPENFSLWNKLAKCRDASLLWRSWNVVLKDEAKGKHCADCGRCEGLCPQHLPIRADLARAQAALDAVPRP